MRVCMYVCEREREQEFMCEKTLCVSEIVFAYGCLHVWVWDVRICKQFLYIYVHVYILCLYIQADIFKLISA